MAGSLSYTHEKTGNFRVVRVNWTGDAADGTVPSLVLPAFGGRLLALETNPGATAPTASYDIAITDGHGHDVIQGVGANRSTSATEKVAIVYSGTAIHPPVVVGDTLTLALTNNSVVSATGEIDLYYGVDA